MFLPNTLSIIALLLLYYNCVLVRSDTSPEEDGNEHNKKDTSFYKLGAKLNMNKKIPVIQSSDDNTPPFKTDFASLMEREMKKQSSDKRDDEESVETDDGEVEGFELLKRKYEVPRTYARPVERILHILKQFPPNSYFHQHPDYYSMLGASKSASAKQINQSYRKVAKSLHPDKNPHPDAKKAFEAVAAAHEELSDPVTRARYDRAVDKKQKQSRSFRLLWRRGQDSVQNAHARLLLLLARLQRGELAVEVTLLKDKMEAFFLKKQEVVINFYYKILFAPSLADKSVLVGEALWNQKISLLSILILLRLIITSC